MANLQNIKEISKLRKIPLKSIAEQIGISEQGIHKMIREETMSAVVLEKVAKILNVNVCVFFDRDILCDHVEEYNATGDRGIAAKMINKVDNRNITPASSCKETTEDMQAKMITLQQDLLDAKSEIINLLKERK